MANIKQYIDSYDKDDDNDCLSLEAANDYAQAVATEAIQEYIKQTGTTTVDHTIIKEDSMSTNTNGLEEVAQNMLKETSVNIKIISGEQLLNLIESAADRFVLSRLPWYKKLIINKRDKEMAVTAVVYFLVHAAKTGGFGLTKYRINHAALDYVTLAANNRVIKYGLTVFGLDLEATKSLLTTPTVSVEE